MEKEKTVAELTLAADETCGVGIGRFNSCPKSIVISYNIRKMTAAETNRFGRTLSAAEIVSLEYSASKTSRNVAKALSSIVVTLDGDAVKILSPEKHPRARTDSKKLPPEEILVWK